MKQRSYFLSHFKKFHPFILHSNLSPTSQIKSTQAQQIPVKDFLQLQQEKNSNLMKQRNINEIIRHYLKKDDDNRNSNICYNSMISRQSRQFMLQIIRLGRDYLIRLSEQNGSQVYNLHYPKREMVEMMSMFPNVSDFINRIQIVNDKIEINQEAFLQDNFEFQRERACTSYRQKRNMNV